VFVSSGADDQPDERSRPPAPVRWAGKALSHVTARHPRLWRFVGPGARRFWDRMAPHWDERLEPDSPEHLAPLLAAVEELPRPPSRILDLGTGTGAAALALARRFPEARVIGVDFSEQMVSAARRKLSPELAGRVEFVAGDASELHFEDGSFDLVAELNMTLFADETARVVAAGGHVLFAHTFGPATPYYTPDDVLAEELEPRGLEVAASGSTGRGTYLLLRRAD
jgi:SAM-dependent methyltransferase